MNEQRRNEIVSRWRAGASIRQIARELSLARNTVSRVLAGIDAQRAGTTTTSLRRPSRLDPYEPVIIELLGRYPDLTGVRLFEELRQRGFSGSYSTVRQRLRALRPRSGPLPVVRFETGPGVQAQMDYAVYDLDFTFEGRRRVNLFSYILGYSRRQYLRFVEAQDMATTLREHVRAFEHLGGVAVTCLYDNMKVVVSGHEDDVPIYNPRFLAFATHYGFRPVACRVRRPQTKGKVERPFYYVETSLFNGRSFESLKHLNEITDWWLAQVADVRELRAAGKTPLQLHQEELPHLIALPAHAYDVAPVIYRTVDVEGLVTYCQNGYSVPWRYIGCVLPVRVTETEVIIYGPQIEEITRHALLPRTARGQRSIHKEHRPSENAHRRQAQLAERFAELGEVGRRFLEGLLRVQRYGKDQAQRVLALLGTYSRSDLIAALERAVRYGAYSHAAVARILSVQARPKTTLEALAEEERALPPWLGEDKISPRPTSGYQYLCESEEDEDEDPNSAQGEAGGDGELRQKILEDFEALGIPLRSEQLDAVVGRVESEGLSHLEFLRLLIGEQANGRRERRIAHRIREAGFAETKTLADFDWQFNAAVIDRVRIETLAEGEFISRRQSLVWVGQSGVGKSHLIQAIGLCACVLGYRVRYETSSSILQELTAALADHTLPRQLRYYAKFDLLILDEVGFDRLERIESPQAASLLYKLINVRGGRSTALVTNIDFEAWGNYWGDPPLAMAFLDRVVDGAIIMKINGKSYRAHRAEQASAIKRPKK